MDINKTKLTELASDCHTKQEAMQNLHKILQKGGTPELASQYAIAKVEYNRAKKLLDLEVEEQSVTIITKGE
jgi:hypothetical protein